MRQTEMKAKAKALQVESRALRSAEKHHRDCGRVQVAVEQHTDIDDLIGRLQACGLNEKQITRIRQNMRKRRNVQHSIDHYAQNKQLHEYRVNAIRPQARMLNLARGYLAGKKYHEIEDANTTKGFDNIALASVINHYGQYESHEWISPLGITTWVKKGVKPLPRGWNGDAPEAGET